MMRSPGLASGVTLTLALGIGWHRRHLQLAERQPACGRFPGPMRIARWLFGKPT
jgi:hypothetical protein